MLSAFWIYDVSNGAVREHQLFYPRTHHGQSYYGAPPATVVYGAAIQNSYDGMRRLTGMSKRNDDWVTWTPIVANATYNLNGQMTSMQYNGLTESRDYNALGQLTSIRYNGTLRHEYRYSATANDGRITSYKNWRSGEDVEYQYDSLGRLSLAQTVGPQWGQAFSYDGFGNLVGKAVTKGSAPVLSVGVDPATNRLTGVSGLSYDANGNMASVPGLGAMAYDGRNRWQGVAPGQTPTRGYDPSNRRIWRKEGFGQDGTNGGTCSGNSAGQLCVGFQKETEYFYFGGRLVKQEAGIWNPASTWYQPDRLGSHAAHHPYGELRGVNWSETPGFATYWRELNGIDYAQQRYYSSTYGRFLTPDPYRASGGPSDPGSWNRYAYVVDDPVNRVDASGLTSCGAEYSFEACFGFGGPMWHGIMPHEGPYFCWDMVQALTVHQGYGHILWNPVCNPFMQAGMPLLMAAMQKTAEKQVPTALRVVDRCYSETGIGGSVGYTLAVRYQVVDQNGQPIYGNSALNEAGVVITERVDTRSGPRIIGVACGARWVETAGLQAASTQRGVSGICYPVIRVVG